MLKKNFLPAYQRINVVYKYSSPAIACSKSNIPTTERTNSTTYFKIS